MKRLLYLSAASTLFFLAACNGGNSSTESPVTTPPAETTTPAPAAPGADIPGIDAVAVTDHIKINGTDDMKYDVTLFKVKAGQKLTLNLKNIGKLPAATMSHNVVILKPGTDMQAFGLAAVKAAATEHIPASMAGDVIAHTKMLGPGQSDEISFTLPSAGVYDFLCSFPGHFGAMNGKIVAQ